MRMLYVGTVGSLFCLPFYLLYFTKPPVSIAVAFFMWSLLLMFFWKFFDEEGNYRG